MEEATAAVEQARKGVDDALGIAEATLAGPLELRDGSGC